MSLIIIEHPVVQQTAKRLVNSQFAIPRKSNSTDSVIWLIAGSEEFHFGIDPRASTVNTPIQQVNYAISTSKMNLNLEKIESYRSLQPGWNGYNGISFNDAVLDKAKIAILSLSHQPHLSPTGRGSIQLDFSKGEDVIEVEIFENSINYFQVVDDEELEETINLFELSERVNRLYGR
jgi:hypothetical protein